MFHVDNIAGIDTYRIVWEAILATERLEILHRYENYSQYGISISGPFGREKSFKALLEIHGIADANPPLMIGDTVLVRPLHRVSLPLKPHEHPPPRPPPPPQPPIPINSKAAKKNIRKERRLAEARMALAMGFQQQMHMFGPHLSPQEQFERQQQFEQVSIQRQQERQHAQIQILRSLQEHHPDNHEAIHKAMHGLQWSPPVHVAEIQGKILSLQRASTKVVVGEDGETKKHNDRVTFSWPEKLESDTLMFTFREAAKAYGNDMGIYNVRFVPSQSKLERCLTALDWLVEAFEDAPGKAMELLFPTSAPDVAIPSSEAASNGILAHSNQQLNQQLNDNQASFVSMVLGRTKHPSTNDIRGPMVLSGPAGTGKTKAMLSAIRAVLDLNGKHGDRDSKHRCLVCTPSHTAADVVTRRLGQHLERDELFRLYDSDRPVATVPVEVLQFCRQSEDESGTFVLPEASTLLNFQVIVCTCSDAHLLYQIGLTNQQLRVRRGCLHAYLKKTCDEANLEFVLLGADECHFTHLFVDEAAQASEPETLIPLSVVADPFGKRKVEIALVGDPRQLSPAVYSNQAAEAGLKKSWMERLLQRPVSCLGGGQSHMLGPDMVQMEEWLKYSFRHNGQEQLSVFLTLNYRGHPSFLMMPSVLFYADKLQSISHEKENAQGESFWCEKMRWVENLSDPVAGVNGIINDRETPPEVLCRKQFDWPLHFRGVVGRDTSVTVESGFASSSWANEKEAEAVVDIVVTLSEQGVLSQSIGVMAPFRGQVVLIRKLLRAKRLGGVNVGSVEDYQAVEHDVIVLSLTRSTLSFVEHDVRNRMGVFGQPKRSNVAMTRAEFLFIVVSTDLFHLSLNVLCAWQCYVVLISLCPDARTGWQPLSVGRRLCLATIPSLLPSQRSLLWGTIGRRIHSPLGRRQASCPLQAFYWQFISSIYWKAFRAS